MEEIVGRLFPFIGDEKIYFNFSDRYEHNFCLAFSKENLHKSRPYTTETTPISERDFSLSPRIIHGRYRHTISGISFILTVLIGRKGEDKHLYSILVEPRDMDTLFKDQYDKCVIIPKIIYFCLFREHCYYYFPLLGRLINKVQPRLSEIINLMEEEGATQHTPLSMLLEYYELTTFENPPSHIKKLSEQINEGYGVFWNEMIINFSLMM